MITNRLARISHEFHQKFARDPFAVILQTMDLPLAQFAARATDGDIFQRTAEAAHCVPFEVRQDNQRIIIGKVRANRNFFEVQAAVDMIYSFPDERKKSLIERIESRSGLRQLSAMAQHQMGTSNYELITIA